MTGSPSGPRMRGRTASSGSPSTGSPSTATIRSPARTPASAAGPPSIGARILIASPSTGTARWTPIPLNRPSVKSSNAATSAGGT